MGRARQSRPWEPRTCGDGEQRKGLSMSGGLQLPALSLLGNSGPHDRDRMLSESEVDEGLHALRSECGDAEKNRPKYCALCHGSKTREARLQVTDHVLRDELA